MHGPTAIAAGLAAGKEQLRAWQDLTGPTPPMTPPLPASTRLCIGMATYDDFDGVWFTIASILLSHPEVVDQVSFVVVDNHPTSQVSAALEALVREVPRYRYVPFRAFQGTSVRDLVFREAQADIVLCLDSHVLLRPGGLAALLRYFDARPDSRDLVQGPLLGGPNCTVMATHLDPDWSNGMFGVWSREKATSDFSETPYELESHGLGLFACRKDAWPGFNPLFRGFGGEEGYLHEKVRRGGGRTVGLPALAWLHRFARPRGVPYAHTWDSFLRNYELGFAELGWELTAGRANFREFVTDEGVFQRAAAAVTHPLAAFDAIMAVNALGQPQRWADLAASCAGIGVGWRLERVPGVDLPDAPDIARALGVRAAVAEASRRGLRSVLVLDDGITFRPDAVERLRPLAELPGRDWRLCFLGGTPSADPTDALREVVPDASDLDAVAVHSDLFAEILAAVPDDPDACAAWLASEGGLAAWLGRCVAPHQAVALTRPAIGRRPAPADRPEGVE